MGCTKCGGAAPAASSVTTLTISLDMAYPMFGSEPDVRVSARQDLAVKLIGSDVFLPAGRLMTLAASIVEGLKAVGAPIWVF